MAIPVIVSGMSVVALRWKAAKTQPLRTPAGGEGPALAEPSEEQRAEGDLLDDGSDDDHADAEHEDGGDEEDAKPGGPDGGEGEQAEEQRPGYEGDDPGEEGG